MSIRYLIFIPFIFCFSVVQAQIDSAFAEIELMSTDSSQVKVADFKDQKAVVLIFTGIHCVYAKKYEDRILKTIETYKGKPVAFLLVNSNDPELSPENDFGKMVARAMEKNYSCPYLSDPEQELSNALGVKKVPEAVVIGISEGKFSVVYRGAIDNNPLMGDRATVYFLKDALNHALEGNMAPTPFQPVKGCNIKSMNY